MLVAGDIQQGAIKAGTQSEGFVSAVSMGSREDVFCIQNLEFINRWNLDL